MPGKVTDDRGTLDTKDEKVEDLVADPVADPFDEAFVEASKPGEKPDISTADNPDNVKDEKVKEVVKTPPVETVEISSVIDEKKPIIDSSLQQPDETDEKYEQRYKTLQGIHKHDKETWETERTKLLSDLEEAKKPKTPIEDTTKKPTKEETAAADAFIDSLTPEQKEELDKYEADFDVVSKMEGIKRTREMAKLRKEMETTIQKIKEEVESKLTATETNLTSRIAPAIKLAEDSDQESHFSIIREGYVREDGTIVPGHNDFEKFRDDGSLLAWIESKPKYLQPTLKTTYENGTATDVVDLISDFKQENNIKSIPNPPDNVVQLNPSKAAKIQALTSVTGRRGAVNASVISAVSDDFEGAFDEALNK